MSLDNTINAFIQSANGGRAGGRDGFFREKTPFLAEDVAEQLRRQWQGAGMDTARVWLKLTEVDGTNPHFVTGWNGKDTFVCLTEQGLAYVTHRKLTALKIDESWNSKTLLIHLRTLVLREQMEKTDVDTLLDRCRRTMIKSGKARRQSRFKNASRYFESDDSKDPAVTATGPESQTEMVPAPKHPVGAPEEPPGADESATGWNSVDEASGKVKRRLLKHHKMGKQDAQVPSREQVDIRCENTGFICARCGASRSPVSEDESSGCGECGERELVAVRGEGGAAKGVAASDGKKPEELDKRQKTTVRHEAEGKKCSGKDCKYDGPDLTYWGDKVYCGECAARAQVDVRHEALDEKFSKRFGGKKAPPFGAKKPLVLFMLMKKGKGKDGKSAGKLGEAALDSSKFKLFKRPEEETDRQEVDSREGKDESTGRSFKTVRTEDDSWHKAHAHKFFANMMKFKNRKGRSKAKTPAKAPVQGVASTMFGPAAQSA